MEGVNIVAVIVAGLVAWGIGAVWYNVLGKAWQNELGFTDEFIQKGNMPLIFGLSAVLMIMMAFGLSFVIAAHGPDITAGHGAFHGAMVGIFYCLTSMGINYLYQRKSVKLWFIDGVYQVLFLAVMGAILAWWPW